MMPTTIEWTLTITSDIVLCGFIIAIMYTLKRFYNHRYSQALQKRSPLLVYLMNICFILYLLYNIIYKISYIHGEEEWNIHSILKEEIDHPQITKLISVICYIFSLHGMVIMWITRSWMIYFNCQYGVEVQRTEWSVYLNDGYSDQLWFMKHRGNLGSNSVIYPITIAWYIIDALLQTLLLFTYPDIWMMYDSAILLIKFIILVVIWNRIPSFNDIFGIKKEMQWMFRVSGFALLLYIGYVVYLMILGYNVWVFLFVEFIFGIIVSFMALILNGFIFHSPNYNYLISETLEREIVRQISPSLSLEASPEDNLSLSQVLENEQLIECLFEHLAKEFSVELLLALIEFKQFHDLMVNDDEFMFGAAIHETIAANSGDTRISESILFRISLPEELPKSKIVHENHYEDEEDNDQNKMYLRIASDLFDKYVSYGAEFEVNLGHECRQKIAYFIQEHNDLSCADLLSENEQFELFMLFHEAANALYNLLHLSQDRYIMERKEFETSPSITA